MSQDAGELSRRTLLVGGGAAAVLAAIGGAVATEWNSPRFVRLRGGCGDTPPIPRSTYTITRGTFDSRAMGATIPWLVALPREGRKIVVDVPVSCAPRKAAARPTHRNTASHRCRPASPRRSTAGASPTVPAEDRCRAGCAAPRRGLTRRNGWDH